MRLSTLAAACTAAALLCGCGARHAPPSAATSAVPAPARPALAGPANAPAARAGSAGAVRLDAAQRSELATVVSHAAPGVRARLRYALASADDGSRHLVVYDGEGLGTGGRHAGRPHEYVVFRVLNSSRGEHYDPQQNAIVEPIPPPVQRLSSVSVP